MRQPNQEGRRKEKRQILKDKQQVRKKKKKCSTQGPRTKKEKLEQKNRVEGMKLKKQKKNKVFASCINFMSFSQFLSLVVRIRQNLFNYVKKKKKEKWYVHWSNYEKQFFFFLCILEFPGLRW